ncbi:MAG: CapA family protein [Allorhizobium sp.]
MAFTIAVTGQILIHGPLDIATPGAEGVLALLRADTTLTNLEATVRTDKGWPTKPKTLHLASPEALFSVRAMGFDAVTHANNHAFDLGPPGIAATRKAATAAGLAFAGSGSNLDEACAPAIITPENGPPLALFAADLGPQPEIVYASAERAGIAPLRVRRQVALPPAEFAMLHGIVTALGDEGRQKSRRRVGYSPASSEGTAFEVFGTGIVAGEAIAPIWSTDRDDFARLTSGIAAAKACGQVVVLSLHCHHWDADWRLTPAWLTDLARDLIDAGADLVIATGAPILQGMSFHRGRPILAGLGNFVFHTDRAATYDETGVDVWRSLAARLTFADDGSCLGVEVLPVAVSRPAENGGLAPLPVPLETAAATEIFERFVAGLSNDERQCVRLVDVVEA